MSTEVNSPTYRDGYRQNPNRYYSVVGESELLPELLSICSLFPFIKHASYSRIQMASGHLGQLPPITKPEVRWLMSGMEKEYGKYVFNIKTHAKINVLKVIRRYKQKSGDAFSTIARSPETTVLYEEVDTKTLGCLELPEYNCNHTFFGYKYKQMPIAKTSWVEGKIIEKDTIIYQSPNVDDNGDYRFGKNLNTCFLAVPGVAEDGIILADDIINDFGVTVLQRRRISFGRDRVPLNIHGCAKQYKVIPDIGDIIPLNGIVAALRPYSLSVSNTSTGTGSKVTSPLALVKQNIHALRRPDFFGFDTLTYAEPGGRVVDVQVYFDPDQRKRNLPVGMDAQLRKYDAGRREYYGELWRYYADYRRRNKNTRLTGELDTLLREAYSVVGHDVGSEFSGYDNKIGKKQRPDPTPMKYKQDPLDEWTVDITIAYTLTPVLGWKFTNLHGSKGVLVSVWPRANMPVDQDGNSADIIMSPQSVPGRMNPSVLYETFINGTSRDVAKRVRERLGIALKQRNAKDLIHDIAGGDPKLFNDCWTYLMRYYEIVSPIHRYDFKVAEDTMGDQLLRIKVDHLAYICTDCDTGINIKKPTNCPRNSVDMQEEMINEYPSTYGPVTYVTPEGKHVVSAEPVRIASAYIVLLEKITTDTYGAVAIGRPQSHGILSKLNDSNKYNLPYRGNPTKLTGETEVSTMALEAGGIVIADLLARSNNPELYKTMSIKIMTADKPTDISYLLDRKVYPIKSKPVDQLMHILNTSGMKFSFKPFVANKKPEGYVQPQTQYFK